MKTVEDRVLETAFKIHNQRHPTHVKKIPYSDQSFHSCILIFPGMCDCMEQAQQDVAKQIKDAETLDNVDFFLLFTDRTP